MMAVAAAPAWLMAGCAAAVHAMHRCIAIAKY